MLLWYALFFRHSSVFGQKRCGMHPRGYSDSERPERAIAGGMTQSSTVPTTGTAKQEEFPRVPQLAVRKGPTNSGEQMSQHGLKQASC